MQIICGDQCHTQFELCGFETSELKFAADVCWTHLTIKYPSESLCSEVWNHCVKHENNLRRPMSHAIRIIWFDLIWFDWVNMKNIVAASLPTWEYIGCQKHCNEHHLHCYVAWLSNVFLQPGYFSTGTGSMTGGTWKKANQDADCNFIISIIFDGQINKTNIT